MRKCGSQIQQDRRVVCRCMEVVDHLENSEAHSMTAPTAQQSSCNGGTGTPEKQSTSVFKLLLLVVALVAVRSMLSGKSTASGKKNSTAPSRAPAPASEVGERQLEASLGQKATKWATKIGPLIIGSCLALGALVGIGWIVRPRVLQWPVGRSGLDLLSDCQTLPTGQVELTVERNSRDVSVIVGVDKLDRCTTLNVHFPDVVLNAFYYAKAPGEIVLQERPLKAPKVESLYMMDSAFSFDLSKINDFGGGVGFTWRDGLRQRTFRISKCFA